MQIGPGIAPVSTPPPSTGSREEIEIDETCVSFYFQLAIKVIIKTASLTLLQPNFEGGLNEMLEFILRIGG